MKLEVTKLVKKSLAGLIPVLVLRGADSLAREGGDLDFIVPSGQAVAACEVVAKAALAQGWFLVGFRDIDYLAQIILIRPVDSGDDEALKIDFFDGLRWYGVGADVAGQLLFNKLLPLQTDEVRLAGAAGFIQKILIVGRGSERDWARVAATGADANYLAETAQSLCLPINNHHIDERGVTGLNKWRLRAASGGATGIISGIVWLLQATVMHLKYKSRLGTKAGFVLGFSGLDGSGKSTLVDRFIAGIQKAVGEPPQLVHLLPAWIPMPHQIFLRHKTQSNYTRPYSEPPVSSRLNGWLRLTFYLCAFSLARTTMWLQMMRGHLIIMDRSFLDFASDLTRSKIPALRIPDWLLRSLIPKGRLFFLNASPDVVVARKGELTVEKAHSLQTSYLATCNTVGATLLDGDRTADEVFKEFLGHLSQEYLQRLIAAATRQ